MSDNSISIDDLRALARAFGNDQREEDHGLCLLVADNAHVWFGHVVTDMRWAHISGARIVRRWGTERGLNQLATEGPRANTILDDPSDVLVASSKVIAIIPCEVSRWSAL